jgi:DICT domain-containing protein
VDVTCRLARGEAVRAKAADLSRRLLGHWVEERDVLSFCAELEQMRSEKALELILLWQLELAARDEQLSIQARNSNT